ncbi:MAG: hypothetical protein IPK33_33105 [Gemmatimonadetes bacterium]|nr:hypothetical protein [Gemmatimonadota bacterium]
MADLSSYWPGWCCHSPPLFSAPTSRRSTTESVLGLWVLFPFLVLIILLRIRWLFTRRPRLVLLLRPFSEPTVNDALVRLVQRHLGFLGFTYTWPTPTSSPTSRKHRVSARFPG